MLYEVITFCAYINELTDDLIDYSDIVVLEKAVQSKYKGVEDSFANKQVILWEGKPLVIWVYCEEFAVAFLYY